MRSGRSYLKNDSDENADAKLQKIQKKSVQSLRLLHNLTRLPCQRDRKKPFDSSRNQSLVLENKNLQNMVLNQLEVVSHLQDAIAEKGTLSHLVSTDQTETELNLRSERRERRMCLLRPTKVQPVPNCELAPLHPQTVMAPVLATRYFGRKSKTIPSRALKRRYLGPPKSIPAKVLAQPQTMIPPPSEPVILPMQAIPSRKQGRPKKILPKVDFLTTDSTYFVPDAYTNTPQVVTSPAIDVPSWALKPVTSFYQMEGTENINDPVFHRRHQKFEQDERRRKRWDMQRIRELRAKEKLKKRQERKNASHQEPHTFFPDPRNIEYIEITDQLPVMAFGHSIPLFQPSEFSLPWLSKESSTSRGRKGRPPLT